MIFAWALGPGCGDGARRPARPGPDGRFLRLGISAVHAPMEFDGRRYLVLEVAVFNDSPTAVPVRVRCDVDTMHLEAAVPPIGGDQAVPHRVRLAAPAGTREDQLPLGLRRVRCTVRPAEANAPAEIEPDDDVFAVEVELERPAYPDLVLAAAEPVRARACTQQAEPIATDATCLRVAWTNVGTATYQAPISVRCTLAGETRETIYDGEAPQPETRLISEVRFQPLAAGHHVARCAVDAGDTMREVDEGNNTIAVPIEVLAGPGDWHYDLAVEHIADVVSRLDLPQGDYPRPPQAGLEVTVRNQGRFAVDTFRVICRGAGTVLEGAWSTIDPGARLVVMVRGGTAPVGSMTCEVALVVPTGVADQTPADNVATTTVRGPGP